MIKEYLLQNWPLVLILLAFIISLNTTVFSDKKTNRRMYLLIVAIFLLSIVVFVEFYIIDMAEYRKLRIVFMALRYSATPLILSLIMVTLIKKLRWFIFIPAILLLIIDIISIFTGIVFKISETNKFTRGPLGLAPFIVAGGYCVALIYILFKRSNKRAMEIVPIIFLFIAFVSGLAFPFVFGSDFANIFCTIIGIALFAYYEFTTLMLSKKDALTGLLNRQAYFTDVKKEEGSITAIVSIDMNGLKAINDKEGHAAGDEAISTLALCIIKAMKSKQSGYRIGGDEYLIVCRKCTIEEVIQLEDRIRKLVSDTRYSCAIGYGFCDDGSKSIEELLKESDQKMYLEKEEYYKVSGRERRRS